MEVIDLELAWAGGLFEGEGYFGWSGTSPVAAIDMTDLDVLERLQAALGVGRVYGPYTYRDRPTRKQYWYWRVVGESGVRYVAERLWPFLSPRRQLAATKSLIRAGLRPGQGYRRDLHG